MRSVDSATLRSLSVRDATALASLSKTLGGHETAADWKRMLSRSGEHALAIGAEAGGSLVGYAAGEVRIAFGLAEPAGWLEAFGVDLAWRGRGVGRELAAAALAQFRKLGAVRAYTVVPVHDRSLLPFLRELGFREESLACLGREL